jgi:presenilin-like A22 family membrane protease
VLVLWLIARNVLVHDIAIILAIAGISAEVGLAMSLPTILILITALSVYDVIAVYRTKHMVEMFKTLVHKGVFLAIIIPFFAKDFLQKTKNVEPGQNYVMLGTGDLAFPLIFAAAVLKTSFLSSLFVIAGAAIGVAIIYIMLITQVQRRAMPALPPIALCSVIAFLISLLVV